VVGGINTVLGLLVFYLVQYFFGKYITYIGSLLTTHLLVSTLGFILYRKYVFKVRGNVLVDFFRFQSVYSVSLISNLVILPVLVSGLHWNVYVAQTLTIAAVTVVSFLGHKFFSFQRPK
jgi:putative flippase GtrA